MTIVIKEINVKTTIEKSHRKESYISEEDIHRIKKEIISDLAKTVSRQLKYRKER